MWEQFFLTMLLFMCPLFSVFKLSIFKPIVFCNYANYEANLKGAMLPTYKERTHNLRPKVTNNRDRDCRLSWGRHTVYQLFIQVVVYIIVVIIIRIHQSVTTGIISFVSPTHHS